VLARAAGAGRGGDGVVPLAGGRDVEE